MIPRLTILICFFCSNVFAQTTDTLTFYSEAFKAERTIYVKTPEFYKYQSDSVKLPVIYILDGQHEWFVKPILGTIYYLQYTHEIPHAIIVTIPHVNRVKECGILSLDEDVLPLHSFITEDIQNNIKDYHPGDFRLIVGHSFSASFALYSYLLAPDFYSAVISNTPLDQFENLVRGFNENRNIKKDQIYLAIGGKEKSDAYHRKEYDRLKSKYTEFFKEINTFEFNSSGHNSVPIVAVPIFLTQIFAPFSARYSKIADVDFNYKLVSPPQPVKIELEFVKNKSKLQDKFYPPELPDINGIASRYLNSGYNQHGIGIYELGIKYFPNYYDFHFELAKLYVSDDKAKGLLHVNKALQLLNTIDFGSPYRQKLIEEISLFKKKNGW